VYLIPLKDYPVFKLGHAKDVITRMASIGIKKHADVNKAIIVRMPGYTESMCIEKGMKALLAQQNNNVDIPDGLRSGNAEFFNISVFDQAVKHLEVSLATFQWDHEFVGLKELMAEKAKSSKPKGRPPRGIDTVKKQFEIPVELAAKLTVLADERFGSNQTMALWESLKTSTLLFPENES